MCWRVARTLATRAQLREGGFELADVERRDAGYTPKPQSHAGFRASAPTKAMTELLASHDPGQTGEGQRQRIPEEREGCSIVRVPKGHKRNSVFSFVNDR